MFDYDSIYGPFGGDAVANEHVDGVELKTGDRVWIIGGTNDSAHIPNCDIDEPPFSIGDVVGLLVGGPDMVVLSMCPQGCIEVAWVDSDGDVCIDAFPEEALVNHE